MTDYQRFGRIITSMDQPKSVKEFNIGSSEFENFEKSFSFLALQDQRLGQAFCNHYDITDHILYHTPDPVRAIDYIKKHYVSAHSQN